jgi:23S rRNA maturation-related 3'-5' exoribonuclease YhaM
MDQQQWRGSEATMLHEVYGLIVRKAGSQHQGIEEYTREGIFEIVCEHLDAVVGEDSKQVTELFYQRIYASRCAVVLI